MLSYIRTASELSSSWLTVYASHGYTEIRFSMNWGRMSPSSHPPTHRSGTISLMKWVEFDIDLGGIDAHGAPPIGVVSAENLPTRPAAGRHHPAPSMGPAR